jgi:hypothetical protein
MTMLSTGPCVPELSRSFKGRFPFRLSVPSYIYPAGYAENARRLGPFVDEIELLLFESAPGSLPGAPEILELKALGRQFDFSYNVHLPIDLHVGAACGAFNRSNTRRLAEVIERTRPLSPALHILHLDHDTPKPSPSMLRTWQQGARDVIAAILQATCLAPRQLALETLDYPPQWFAPLVDRMDLGVCVDIGHVVRYGMDLGKTLQLFEGRIEMIHLHGTSDGQDHQSLDCLAPHAKSLLQTYLQGYRGAVSIEVFSFERLQQSLDAFEQMMSPPVP